MDKAVINALHIWCAFLQDSPSVKSTYTASVSVPEALKALMSANLESEQGQLCQEHDGYRTFKFRQDIPIPSYLLAIAVGNLESRSLGPRSKVVGCFTLGWHYLNLQHKLESLVGLTEAPVAAFSRYGQFSSSNIFDLARASQEAMLARCLTKSTSDGQLYLDLQL